MFKCHTCNSKFTNPKELIQHISSVHVGGKTQNLSKNHVSTVHEGKKHSEAILSKSELVKPNKTVYMEEKSAKSEDFEEQVKQNSSEVSETLDSSLHEHDQISNVHERLADSKHKSTIHEGKKKVELKACMYCDYTFSSLVKLQKHLKVGHEEKKLNRCIYCDQNFSSKISLQSHINKGSWIVKVCSLFVHVFIQKVSYLILFSRCSFLTYIFARFFQTFSCFFFECSK